MGLSSRGQETRNNALSLTKLGRKADPCQKKKNSWARNGACTCQQNRKGKEKAERFLPLVSPTQHVTKIRKKKPACSFFPPVTSSHPAFILSPFVSSPVFRDIDLSPGNSAILDRGGRGGGGGERPLLTHTFKRERESRRRGIFYRGGGFAAGHVIRGQQQRRHPRKIRRQMTSGN